MSKAVTIPAGTTCLTIPKAGAKLCKSKSWVWERIKNDPGFPKPIYIGGPVLLEHELDAWLATQVEKSRTRQAA